VRLMKPERFEQVMLVIRVTGVKRGNPFLEGGHYFACWPTSQFDAGPVAHAVFRLLQHVEQLVERLAGNGNRLIQRPAFVGYAINAAMLAVAARVAQVVLHVADDRVLPIEEVKRSIWADFQIAGAEVRVSRANNRLLLDAPEAGAVVFELVAQNALKANHVG